MSRCYEFRITVSGYEPERLGEICAALHTQWDFDPSGLPIGEDPPPQELDATGVDNLCAGMTAEEMAERLARAVWAANGAYCEVEARSLYLDDQPPSDTHTWEEGDYEEWIEQAPQAEEAA